MAKARKVSGDINSQEFDILKRNFNTLLLMLQNMGTSITAGATAAQVLSVISDGVAAGLDNNPNAVANVTTTGREITGLDTVPRRPHRPQQPVLKDYTSSDPV